MEYFIFQKSPPSLLTNFSNTVIIIMMLFFDNGGDAATTLVLPKKETVPAVFVFGDSIVDPGNNNYIETVVKVNWPPYGRDFFGGKPTGRFSDGKVPSDLIAELFGVKGLLPAYLSPNLQLQDYVSGVSFASGGSGYDPLTSQILSVLSLTDQLKMFKQYIKRIKPEVGDNKTQTILSKSIYVLFTGSNDIANTYYSTPFRRFQYDVPAYTDLMVNSARSFLKGLYGFGARRIGVVSVPAIGCVPSQRILDGGIERRCSEASNNAANLFNSKLYLQMDSINRKFPDARLVYFDIFYPLLSLIQNPSKYGFEVVDKGCCGTGNLEVGILCNPFTPTSCANASKYIFWDSYHPTQQAYEVLNSLVFNKNIHKFF